MVLISHLHLGILLFLFSVSWQVVGLGVNCHLRKIEASVMGVEIYINLLV